LLGAAGLCVALACGQASAQDQPPAIKVLIGDDGSVKVIDAATGKEITGAKAGEPKPIDEVLKLWFNAKKPPEAHERWEIWRNRGQDQDMKDLLKLVEKIRKEKLGIEIPPDKKGEAKPKGFKILIGPDGKLILIQDDKKPAAKAPPANVDQKLDLILKQLDELRKDVDGIKKRIDAKPGGRIEPKPGFPVPNPPRLAPGTAIDPAVKKELDALLKEAADGQKQIEDLLKKIEAKEPPRKPALPAPPDIDRTKQLERRIELLLREVEDLRREIEKNKK
jgi:hypothetical protein